jgi:hypothetical protein
MTTKKVPTPRPCYGFGYNGHTGTAIGDTWLECEALCYPDGGMNRRAYAICEDGVNRVIRCGIPDTVFSIPGRVQIDGKMVKGFVSSDEAGFKFTAYKKQD